MLHKDSFIIAPKTFELIQELQKIEELKDFNLVGGTALALMLGHRNFVDINLFNQNSFDENFVMDMVAEHYEVNEIFRRKYTIICLINNIKTYFIRHDYPLLKPLIQEEGIRMASLEDIAAMKFHAIIQSGKRLKDFIDIYFLLEHFIMNQMVGFFIEKYTYMNPMMAIKAVNYFDDIDPNIDPPNLLEPLPLHSIKERIRLATQYPDKSF
jgi:hypothetical protein